MDKIIAVVAGCVCGVGQFFLMRHTLKPLAQGKDPKTALFMILKLPIPLVLLVGCALVNPELLPYAGSAFCLSMVVATDRKSTRLNSSHT